MLKLFKTPYTVTTTKAPAKDRKFHLIIHIISVNFRILYILLEMLHNVNHLGSHYCKGADQMTRVYNMYNRDKFLLGKENEFVMAVSIRYSTVWGKVHGLLESYPNLNINSN